MVIESFQKLRKSVITRNILHNSPEEPVDHLVELIDAQCALNCVSAEPSAPTYRNIAQGLLRERWTIRCLEYWQLSFLEQKHLEQISHHDGTDYEL